MMVARGAETRLGHPFRTLHERPLRGIAGSHAHGPFPGVGHNTVIRGISSLRLFSIPANAGANTVFAKSSNVVDDVLVFERGSALDAPGADASLSRCTDRRRPLTGRARSIVQRARPHIGSTRAERPEPLRVSRDSPHRLSR